MGVKTALQKHDIFSSVSFILEGNLATHGPEEAFPGSCWHSSEEREGRKCHNGELGMFRHRQITTAQNPKCSGAANSTEKIA